MVTTYFLRERKSLDDIADSMILRIIDRNTVLVGTMLGCVYTDRFSAAMCLREFRNRQRNPFHYNGEQRQFMEYEKQVSK